MPKSTHTAEYARFRELLVQARTTAGLSQREVAGRLGKPPSFVAKVEAGERRLDVVEFLAYSRAVDADSVSLLRAIQRSR